MVIVKTTAAVNLSLLLTIYLADSNEVSGRIVCWWIYMYYIYLNVAVSSAGNSSYILQIYPFVINLPQYDLKSTAL